MSVFYVCGGGDAPPDLRLASMPVCRLRTPFLDDAQLGGPKARPSLCAPTEMVARPLFRGAELERDVGAAPDRLDLAVRGDRTRLAHRG